MEGIALVLCGGGGKGAFQIGAMRALQECGILDDVKAIAGTSVGALNAVLYALGDYDFARDIWKSINKGVILPPNKDDVELFSRDGLIEIIDKVPLDKLRQSEIKVYATIQNEQLELEYICLNELSNKDIKKVLLASSAIPIVFPAQEFKGDMYIDGGFLSSFGNTPVEPLYKYGYEEIFIIALRPYFNIHSIIGSDGIIDYEARYHESNLTVIRPLDNIGGPLNGTLNFDQSAILHRIGTGYNNTMDILQNGIPDNTPKFGKIEQNRNMEVNEEIRKQIDAMYASGENLEMFVNTTVFDKRNANTRVMDVGVWYNDIVTTPDGWKVQQHTLFPSRHYRILDSNGKRRAWFWMPDELLDALKGMSKNEEYTAMNRRIIDRITNMFKSGKDFEAFVSAADCNKINAKGEVWDMGVWYNDIINVDGWKVQQHTLFKGWHYRILDPDGIRRAWFWKPDELLEALKRYENMNKVL